MDITADKPEVDSSVLSARLSADPMRRTDVYSRQFPLPHLETFLEEVDALNPELIESNFIATLFSVSIENTTANDSQKTYSRLMAFGFCSDPDSFTSIATIVLGTDGNPYIRNNYTARQAIQESTAEAVATALFGLDKKLSGFIKQSQILPTNTIIRLAQIGVVNADTFQNYENYRLNAKFHNLGTAANLSVHILNPVTEERLMAHVDNKDVLRFLCLTPNTMTAIDAMDTAVDFGSVVEAMKMSGASADEALSAGAFSMDNELLNRLING